MVNGLRYFVAYILYYTHLHNSNIISIEKSTPSCFRKHSSLYEAAVWLAAPEQDVLRRLAGTLADARIAPLSAPHNHIEGTASIELAEKVHVYSLILIFNND